jgi:hypothetical protein
VAKSERPGTWSGQFYSLLLVDGGGVSAQIITTYNSLNDAFSNSDYTQPEKMTVNIELRVWKGAVAA